MQQPLRFTQMEGAFGLNVVEQNIFSQCVMSPPHTLSCSLEMASLGQVGVPCSNQAREANSSEPKELYLKEGMSKSVLEGT